MLRCTHNRPSYTILYRPFFGKPKLRQNINNKAEAGYSSPIHPKKVSLRD